MYNPPQLYDPSKVIRANPETLSGLLLMIGNSWTGTHFFEFASLEAKRLEEVVETFPHSLRDDGRKMIHDSLQNAPQNGSPKFIYIAGYTNSEGVYLNLQIKGADRYDLGFVSHWEAFLLNCLDVSVGYFLDYDLRLRRVAEQKPL